MSTATSRDEIAAAFGELASAAGAAIMSVYGTDFEATAKADGSPVTLADEAAEAIILPGLARMLPGIPVLSEESASKAGVGVFDAEHFILVDPLDGTREFLKRNGEFTVNIALIQLGVPVCGAVFAPALRRLYLGGDTAASMMLEPGRTLSSATARRELSTREYPEPGVSCAVSRSHLDDETAAFLARLPVARRVQAGSSLKFCRIAEAAIDVYPRFGPTMEWDTAAGHAVLAAAGGCVLTPTGEPFVYGKRSSGFRNGPFVAWGRKPIQERQLVT